MNSDSSTGTVAVVGTLNLDQVVRVDRLPADGETVLGLSQSERPGGKGANQAAAAADLGPTALIGAVGGDDAGSALLEHQRHAGVDVGRVLRVDGLSGRALIEVDADGNNRIIVLSGANAALPADHVLASLDAIDPSVVLTQLESPYEITRAVANWCRAHHTRFVLNPSPCAPLDDSVVSLADPLIVNEIEARYYAQSPSADSPLPNASAHSRPSSGVRSSSSVDSVAEHLLSGCRSVVITLGAEGVVVAGPDGIHRIEVRQVRAVDTTGAGDVFAGTLLAHLGAGRSLHAAARNASSTATDFVTRPR